MTGVQTCALPILRANVKAGDLISIITTSNGEITFKNLKHNNQIVGRVSLNAIPSLNNIQTASDFVVNEVATWCYQETLDYDERNGTDYSQRWCTAAKEKGYVYIVDFAGYGHIE